jgi:hypothetical protein
MLENPAVSAVKRSESVSQSRPSLDDGAESADEWAVDDSNDELGPSGSSSRTTRRRVSGPGGEDAADGADSAPARGGSVLVSPELRARLDVMFVEFLRSICSNLEATDSRGELIHQTLMPKRSE